MSAAKDGGAAFPLQEHGEARSVPGMTLRDYFAGLAMSGMMHDLETPDGHHIAKESYKVADAMLLEREK